MKLSIIHQKNNKTLTKATRVYNILSSLAHLNLDAFEIDSGRDFFTIISTLTPQSKAPQTQKWIGRKLNLTAVKASANRGDFFSPETNQYTELKTSFTNAANALNLRQIRLYQDVENYLCIFIDEDDFTDSRIFHLTKEQMIEEVELIGGFTHGTKEVNATNINPEYSITIPMKSSSPILTRWESKYRSKDLEFKLFDLHLP